jgi:hypothetical protein
MVMAEVDVIAFHVFVAIPDEKVCNADHVWAIARFAYSAKEEAVAYIPKEAVVR